MFLYHFRWPRGLFRSRWLGFPWPQLWRRGRGRRSRRFGRLRGQGVQGKELFWKILSWWIWLSLAIKQALDLFWLALVSCGVHWPTDVCSLPLTEYLPYPYPRSDLEPSSSTSCSPGFVCWPSNWCRHSRQWHALVCMFLDGSGSHWHLVWVVWEGSKGNQEICLWQMLCSKLNTSQPIAMVKEGCKWSVVRFCSAN